jgi:hypothetical protein
MREAEEGVPETGRPARTLGVRTAVDVPAVSDSDVVVPGEGGMSVSPDDPMNLPVFRRPPEFQGTGKDPVWVLDSDQLPPELTYRPDPVTPGHGFIEPASEMTLGEYQKLLEATQSLWQPVESTS